MLLECILLLVISPNASCIPMEKTNHVNSCNSRVHAYKNGKTMEQCKEEARQNTRVLSKELLENGEVSWTRVLDTAGNDELVYKLTLKYLRQQGYDIGNNKIPRVKPNTGL
jgi:alkylated DNA nucleotide flippase Atl1